MTHRPIPCSATRSRTQLHVFHTASSLISHISWSNLSFLGVSPHTY